MKIMKETRKLTKEQAKLHLDGFGIYDCDRMACEECMFDVGGCDTEAFTNHANKHNITPEQSYSKWRSILKSIVEGEE